MTICERCGLKCHCWQNPHHPCLHRPTTLESATLERDRYKQALERIREILGAPCSDNTCLGCGHEMTEAVEIAKKALAPVSLKGIES